MGAVEVLQPRDCLIHHHALSQRSLPFPTPPPSNKPHKKAHSINGPKKAHLSSRKRNPRPKTSPPDSSKNLLMGQVKILRRGEGLPGSMEEGTKGLLPLPLPPEEFVPSRRVNGFYAGSAAFVASPPPSSVPLPGFFAKRGLSARDSSTNDLRRILMLD